MKKLVQILPLLLILVLASCSGDLSDMAFSGFSPGFHIPEGFYDNLANEYQAIADYEKDYLNNPEEAAHFTAKARRALRHQDIAPDAPAERTIPAFAVAGLTEAYARLTDALATMHSPGNDALLAIAQSRYDCWLALREAQPDKDAPIACKDDFRAAISLLTLPESDKTIYSIYFNSGSIAITGEGKETVRQVARLYSDRDEWKVVLKGYTDAKGNKSQNKVLSMRRAIAVKHALAQYGIPYDNIEISAEGEAAQGEGAEGRRVDILARPVYAARNSQPHLHIAPGWQHTNEF